MLARVNKTYGIGIFFMWPSEVDGTRGVQTIKKVRDPLKAEIRDPGKFIRNLERRTWNTSALKTQDLLVARITNVPPSPI